MGQINCRYEYNDPSIDQTYKMSKTYYSKYKTKRYKDEIKSRIQKNQKDPDQHLSDEDENRKISCECYKKVLQNLLERQMETNKKNQTGDFSTYMIPFKKLVERTNPQKFERLYLNLKAARFEAEEIMKKADAGQQKQQEQFQNELQKFIYEMVKQELNQQEIKRKKRIKSLYPSNETMNTQFFQAQSSLETHSISKHNMQKQPSIMEDWENKGGSFFAGNRKSSISCIDGGPCQPHDLIATSMANPFSQFSCPEIQIQKYLFNYLYDKVTRNQHIVNNLIEEFSSLINDKFCVMSLENKENIEQKTLQSLADHIQRDLNFFITLLKEYLTEIYGTQMLERFSLYQKDSIFDIFVRKIVFDNNGICNIVRNAVAFSSEDKLKQLENFFKQLKTKVNLKNAFSGKLNFLKHEQVANPFEPLNYLFQDIFSTSSPFLKYVQFKELRDRVIAILNDIYSNHKAKYSQRQSLRLNIEADDFNCIYNFIVLYSDVKLYLEVKLVQLYATKTEQSHVFAFLVGIYDEFLMCSQEGEEGIANALALFNGIHNLDDRNSDISKIEEEQEEEKSATSYSQKIQQKRSFNSRQSQQKNVRSSSQQNRSPSKTQNDTNSSIRSTEILSKDITFLQQLPQQQSQLIKQQSLDISSQNELSKVEKQGDFSGIKSDDYNNSHQIQDNTPYTADINSQIGQSLK